MKEINEKLQEKLSKLEKGDLELNELESLVEDARELYEWLLIVKFKAYENYGSPKSSEDPNEEAKADESKDDTPKEEESIDFSAISEEPEIEEQPSFDFSGISEKEEEKSEPVMIPSEEIKSFDESEEEEEDRFPISSGTKDQPGDVFKDSHVEKHEDEDENSLNQKLQSAEDELSLRKKLQSTPVTDLKSEISIAKKFEYITFMFDGKNEIYDAAIEDLNNCANGEDAKNKLNEYSTTYNWDLENKSIIKFVELVERRYL